jgi:hypothetical protein
VLVATAWRVSNPIDMTLYVRTPNVFPAHRPFGVVVGAVLSGFVRWWLDRRTRMAQERRLAFAALSRTSSPVRTLRSKSTWVRSPGG